ncbi:hypothetical protein SGRIM128S_09615 [Streptomyces griseomycini]
MPASSAFSTAGAMAPASTASTRITSTPSATSSPNCSLCFSALPPAFAWATSPCRSVSSRTRSSMRGRSNFSKRSVSRSGSSRPTVMSFLADAAGASSPAPPRTPHAESERADRTAVRATAERRAVAVVRGVRCVWGVRGFTAGAFTVRWGWECCPQPAV